MPASMSASLTTLPTRTHCPYCAFQCGMLVTGTDGEPRTEVKADPEFPVNRGQMCIKGFTAGDLIDHPARLTAPKLRARDGRMVPVSWDAALDKLDQRTQR